MREDLKSLWLTETVRLVESESGRFFDQDANRQANMVERHLERRIITRAMILSEKHGLISAQRLFFKAIKFSFILICFLSIIVGATLALGTLSQNPVNLYWALFSLLGVHLVTLLIWLFSSLFIPNGSGSVFIYCWLWLAQKLAAKQTLKQLFPSFISLFGGRILWLIGFVVNLFWTLILSTALIVLLIIFSTKHYSFEWKTTLLSPDIVVIITHYLGKLPALLGFPIPNADMIRMSEYAISSDDVRSAWAIWLLGIFIVYGVLVRFLLMVFCGLKWLHACQKITLDLTKPDYQLLATQLMPTKTQIIDDDNSPPLSMPPLYSSHINPATHNGAFIVAIDMEEHWQAPDYVTFLGFLNTREQRKTILDYLQLSPAKKLLIAIDTDRTPDRGMLNLINQLMAKSVQSRIWLVNQGKQLNNWQSLSFELAEPTWLVEESSYDN